ncbi:unnamed protein product [Caenorhabditis angaria]|uniref:Uncharacterized protein n=1 Tax=Caenorhabditis angaria TaxID=860376 RepID=A0A9P1J1P1_9PELO|nr:unnamed protein product [Caenorhabditis angaria]
MGPNIRALINSSVPIGTYVLHHLNPQRITIPRSLMTDRNNEFLDPRKFKDDTFIDDFSRTCRDEDTEKNLIIRHNILKKRMMVPNFSNNTLYIRNLFAYSEY